MNTRERTKRDGELRWVKRGWGCVEDGIGYGCMWRMTLERESEREQKGRVDIERENVGFFFINILTCFKCYKFEDHPTKDCEVTELRCSECAATGHK